MDNRIEYLRWVFHHIFRDNYKKINEQYYIDGKIDLPNDWSVTYLYFARRLFCSLVHDAFTFATSGGEAPGKSFTPYRINFVQWCDETTFQKMHKWLCNEMERLFIVPTPRELQRAIDERFLTFGD